MKESEEPGNESKESQLRVAVRFVLDLLFEHENGSDTFLRNSAKRHPIQEDGARHSYRHGNL
jgi:hypothetical protein